jgi:hypothetical protein
MLDNQGRYIILDGDKAVKGTESLLLELGLLAGTDEYVTVPETTLPTGQVVPSFQVSKYMLGEGQNRPPVISAEAKPLANINYAAARKLCSDIGATMITETQALAIAVNIASMAVNWSGGEVGAGKLHRGIHKGSVSTAQPGNVEVSGEERRWHELTNGQRIYDWSGNLWTWVFDDVQGDAAGLVKGRIEADSPSLRCAPENCQEKGGGYVPSGPLNWSGGALMRGGYWFSGDRAGVFRLYYDWPVDGYSYVGVRCTKGL